MLLNYLPCLPAMAVNDKQQLLCPTPTFSPTYYLSLLPSVLYNNNNNNNNVKYLSGAHNGSFVTLAHGTLHLACPLFFFASFVFALHFVYM